MCWLWSALWMVRAEGVFFQINSKFQNCSKLQTVRFESCRVLSMLTLVPKKVEEDLSFWRQDWFIEITKLQKSIAGLVIDYFVKVFTSSEQSKSHAGVLKYLISKCTNFLNWKLPNDDPYWYAKMILIEKFMIAWLSLILSTGKRLIILTLEI